MTHKSKKATRGSDYKCENCGASITKLLCDRCCDDYTNAMIDFRKDER